MDTTTELEFIDNCQDWAAALSHKQGWKLSYWETEDWRQYGALWALIVLRRYKPANAQHAFSLVRTCVWNDLATRSLNQRLEALPEGLPEPSVEDSSLHYCLPQAATALVEGVLLTTRQGWEQAELAWKQNFPRKRFYRNSEVLGPTVEGLSFMLGLPLHTVNKGIVQLYSHLYR